ncbi:nuclear transport factor 2 family protein, partial [Dehalococcoidia bacterium]|nr:nuclear transport factor 2 family protein [Dehalococcoidia bacterium]
RMDEMIATFTEDGMLEYDGKITKGRTAIKERLLTQVKERRNRSEAGQRVFLRHNLSTSHVEMRSPTEADASTYFFVTTEAGLSSTGIYMDQFIRVGDRWLIRYRRVRTD